MRLLFVLLLFPGITNGQELFTYTEPASNMAAKGIGIRLNNQLMQEHIGGTVYSFNPEVMWGVSRNFMMHADAFFSNRGHAVNGRPPFRYNGAGTYLKYRFYSQDEVHNHFRMAAFGRFSTSNAMVMQPAIDLAGGNTGYEIGIVATKLINKVAMSANGSFLHAGNNGSKKFPYEDKYRNAIGYALSLGKLMLPKEYTDYNQTNLNIMLELLGQYNPALKAGYADLAPSLQLIIMSKMRIDLGYRFAVYDRLFRNNENGFLLRLEYNIFNAYK